MNQPGQQAPPGQWGGHQNVQVGPPPGNMLAGGEPGSAAWAQANQAAQQAAAQAQQVQQINDAIYQAMASGAPYNHVIVRQTTGGCQAAAEDRNNRAIKVIKNNPNLLGDYGVTLGTRAQIIPSPVLVPFLHVWNVFQITGKGNKVVLEQQYDDYLENMKLGGTPPKPIKWKDKTNPDMTGDFIQYNIPPKGPVYGPGPAPKTTKYGPGF